MKSVQKIDLGLTGYDELFMNDAERKENKLPRIYDIPLSEIDDFPDHPFKVKLDEDMDQLVQSIKERGIITPVTLRPKEDGRYEIVSGHRRKKACELAGFDTVKAEVREMTRDEALAELEKPPYPLEQQKEDESYILKKLDIDPATWQRILEAPPTPDDAYFSQQKLFNAARRLLGQKGLDRIKQRRYTARG